MANVVVVGAQWGDEGKGKIVDWLSEQADVVVRFQGGHNAGHTLVIGDKVYKLSLLPSGVVTRGHAVTNLGSVVLGILLAQQRLEVNQAVSALTVTASYVARRSHEEPEPSEMFTAEMQQMVRRLLQYVQLSP